MSYKVIKQVHSLNHAVREYWVEVVDGFNTVDRTVCMTQQDADDQIDEYRRRLNQGWTP